MINLCKCDFLLFQICFQHNFCSDTGFWSEIERRESCWWWLSIEFTKLLKGSIWIELLCVKCQTIQKLNGGDQPILKTWIMSISFDIIDIWTIRRYKSSSCQLTSLEFVLIAMMPWPPWKHAPPDAEKPGTALRNVNNRIGRNTNQDATKCSKNYLQQMKERKNEEHPLNTSRSAMAHQTAFGMYVPEILLLDGVPPPNFTLFLDATFDLHSDSIVETTFGKEL